MNLILFILATACLSYVVTQGDLFKKTREWITKRYEDKRIQVKPSRTRLIWKFLNEVINCPLCFGFWAGILLFLLMEYFKHYEYVFYALAGAICSYVIYLLIKKLKS